MKRPLLLVTFCLLVLFNMQTSYANFFQNLEIFRTKNTIRNIAYGPNTLQKIRCLSTTI